MGNNTLRSDSCHPSHMVKNFLIREYIRNIQSCSTESNLSKEIYIIDKRLIQRGYSWQLLNRAKNIARSKTRQQYLFTKKTHTSDDHRLVFSTPYSKDFDHLYAIKSNTTFACISGAYISLREMGNGHDKC